MDLNKVQQSFINNIYRECITQGYKYDNMCPLAVTAQAVIESKWGQSKLSKYHNYFGLKVSANWTGKSVKMPTKEEYVKGVLTQIYANFRVYDDMTQGVKGYYDFISTKRYANLKHISDPLVYLSFIKDDGYATSSQYVTNCYRACTLIKPYLQPEIQPDKSVYEVAKEVIKGLWGSGKERQSRLELAGYNYKEVQQMVNDLLR